MPSAEGGVRGEGRRRDREEEKERDGEGEGGGGRRLFLQGSWALPLGIR